MYEIIKGIIESRNYNLADLERRILKVFVLGKLTAEEMDALLTFANANVNDTLQIDIAATLADLEQRVSALESAGVKVWVQGQVTARGQVVLFDLGDGILSRVRYDGGRATTTSRPGNIEGWVVVDGSGTPTHTISKVDGVIVLTPIE